VAEEPAVKTWLATVAVAVASAVLLVIGARHATPADTGVTGLAGAAFTVASLAFATVGALVRARVPGNRMGPIFCVMGAILGLGTLVFQYADLALFIHPGLRGGVAAAWLQNFGLPSSFGLLGIAVLLFPDGRPPSPRWRWVLWLAVAGMVLNAVGYGLRPGPLDPPLDNVDNPFGIPGALDPMDALTGLGWMLMGASVGLAAAAGAVRFRRAHGVERAQLKWLGLGGAVTGIVIVADVISYFANVQGVDGVRNATLALGFITLPVTAGVAILRHRLYDIDVVINRALVYGALSATLAATYLALVLLIGLTIGHSNAAIAVSTLAVAALFRPLRARIQGGVDRRFYRRRYDAARTLEAFGSRLRDEVDVDHVAAHLHDAVRESVQPAHLTLWLPSERP
jgi:hypothetical protein